MAQHHIAISGAQGGGKSSLLAELQLRGYHVDAFRVSRAVQAQLGWKSLDRVLESPQKMMQFQEEVFRQKYNNDKDLHFQPGEVTLVERSFADIAAYTMTWMWKFVDRDSIKISDAISWLSDYVGRCMKAQLEVYSGSIILPLMPHIVFEEDPHRAKREDVDSVFENLTRFLEQRALISHPTFTVTAKTISERADQVKNFIEKLS